MLKIKCHVQRFILFQLPFKLKKKTASTKKQKNQNKMNWKISIFPIENYKTKRKKLTREALKYCKMRQPTNQPTNKSQYKSLKVEKKKLQQQQQHQLIIIISMHYRIIWHIKLPHYRISMYHVYFSVCNYILDYIQLCFYFGVVQIGCFFFLSFTSFGV